MTDIPDYTPEPMAPAIIVASLITLALCVGLAGHSLWGHLNVDTEEERRRAHIESGLDFPPLTVDHRRLERERDAFYREPDLELIADEIEELRTTFRQTNHTQFPLHGTAGTLEIMATAELLKQQASDVLPVVGPRGFEPVARPHFDACREGIEDLAKAIRSGALPFSQANHDPPPDRFQGYRKNCGNLLPVLHRHELIDDEGHWTHPDSLVLVDIIQRYRWADVVRSDFPAYRLISPYELELFYRWRIEHDAALSPIQRREILEQARPFLPPDYEYELAEARLRAATMDDQVEIRERFQAIADAHPDDQFYSDVYHTVRKQLRSQTRSD